VHIECLAIATTDKMLRFCAFLRYNTCLELASMAQETADAEADPAGTGTTAADGMFSTQLFRRGTKVETELRRAGVFGDAMRDDLFLIRRTLAAHTAAMNVRAANSGVLASNAESKFEVQLSNVQVALLIELLHRHKAHLLVAGELGAHITTPMYLHIHYLLALVLLAADHQHDGVLALHAVGPAVVRDAQRSLELAVAVAAVAQRAPVVEVTMKSSSPRCALKVFRLRA